MESLVGQKNMICHRIFLPYKIPSVLVGNHQSILHFTMKKGFKKFFMYWLLQQINFFFPTKGSFGILVMDFEGIFDVIFFFIKSQPSTLC